MGPHDSNAHSVELGFGFSLKTGNCTVKRIQYSKFTVNFIILHLSCKIYSPFRPPDLRPGGRPEFEFVEEDLPSKGLRLRYDRAAQRGYSLG